MKQSDAANILGLQDEITPEITKKAYRDAAKKYHPDINPTSGRYPGRRSDTHKPFLTAPHCP